MSLLPTGSPHFKGVYHQNRQSDYDLKKAICEFVDNPITKKECNHIHIGFRLSSQESGYLSHFTISDDYLHGFEHMFQEGTRNPFNMTHMRSGHEDDQETSQFGIGLKAGAISTGDRLDVYTKVQGKYYLVVMDFIEMCERTVNSFSPTIRELKEEEYRAKHPFVHGSTLILSCINPAIYGYTTRKDLQEYLIKELSDTYNDMLKDVNVVLKVNDVEIVYKKDIYDTPECLPFTRVYNIFKYKKIDNEKERELSCYVMTDGASYYQYDVDENKAKPIPKKDFPDLKEAERIATLKSTFTYFSPEITKINIPYGVVHLYRKGRRYGSWKDHGSKTNGGKNYNLSKIDIESKTVAKQLGLTFNKNIAENLKNTETRAFNCFIGISVKGFNADTSQKGFTNLLRTAEEHNIPDRKILEEEKPKKRRTKSETYKEKTASIPEVEHFIDTEIEHEIPTSPPVALPRDHYEKYASAKPEPKKTVVGPFIKGGLTHEQLTELLNQDRQLLQYHPAMIHAYNEIIMKS